ncbi:MAG: response regulator, partial [Gammaproteobacteria bacterium]|nr:response regulator [Gammaproteobacteria bacterium]
DGNGNLLFSSYEGVIIYNPNWEIVEQQSPTLVVSDISLTSIDNKDLVKEKVRIPWRAKNEVAMDYEEGTLAIQLSLLTFSASEYANIRYRIVELDHTWSTVSGSSALISYNFLPYGKFTLQAIGRDFDGIESDLLEIPIHINPPLWATWWAYCFYLFIAALVIFGTFHLRTRAIKAQANKLQAMVNVRTKELAKEKALVEKLLAKKDDEFANISHEFRTPITLILGPIQKLLKSNIRPSTRKTLEMVKRNGFRVLRMVDQILNLEKFKLNQIANYGVIDVKPISTLIAKNFSELANEKGIELTVIQIDDIQLSFTYDAFEKILLNLLSNAVKYTLPGGKVSLAIFQTEGSEIKIQVTDSGIGIPFEQQSAIFERFSRIEDISSTSVVGAGIGLALVKQLVEHHNGRIDLQSEPGKGTQVTVTFLPELVTEQTRINDKVNTELLNMEIESLREVSVEQATNVSTELSDSNGDRPLVLIVEDNLDMRNFIVDSVDDHYEILTAENGQEGLTKAIQHIPDLIISDIMMPKMDGYEFSEQLKDDPVTSHIPLILLTARGDKESRLKGWRQRADEYLTKPFDNEELNLRIESLLSIRKILRERFANEMTNNEDPVWSITSGMSERDQALIIEVDSFFNEHFQDPDLELSRLADRLAMSERQLQRKFKALFDRSPSDYLRSFRLTKSKEQLRKGLRVSEVAFNVGFNSQAYFSKCFKAQFGMTAKEYQESGKVIESATEAQ